MWVIKLYWDFIKMFLKVKFEYKVAFFFELISNAITIIVMYLGFWLIFDKFKFITGWNYYEIVFIYSINILCVAISGMVIFSPMMSIFNLVRQGSFDSMLIRPIDPLLHLIFKNFSYTYIPWLIPVPFALYSCFVHLDIQLTLTKILLFSFLFLGGLLINIGLLISAGALSFWLIDSGFLVSILCMHNNSIRSFCDFPITIYSKWIQVILTFVIPYAFTNFYPSLYFLNRRDIFLFHPYFQFGTPIVGIIVFGISLLIWKKGLSRYQSTGS